jgi:hypothetical protein
MYVKSINRLQARPTINRLHDIAPLTIKPIGHETWVTIIAAPFEGKTFTLKPIGEPIGFIYRKGNRKCFFS